PAPGRDRVEVAERFEQHGYQRADLARRAPVQRGVARPEIHGVLPCPVVRAELDAARAAIAARRRRPARPAIAAGDRGHLSSPARARVASITTAHTSVAHTVGPNSTKPAIAHARSTSRNCCGSRYRRRCSEMRFPLKNRYTAMPIDTGG